MLTNVSSFYSITEKEDEFTLRQIGLSEILNAPNIPGWNCFNYSQYYNTILQRTIQK